MPCCLLNDAYALHTYDIDARLHGITTFFYHACLTLRSLCVTTHLTLRYVLRCRLTYRLLCRAVWLLPTPCSMQRCYTRPACYPFVITYLDYGLRQVYIYIARYYLIVCLNLIMNCDAALLPCCIYTGLPACF